MNWSESDPVPQGEEVPPPEAWSPRVLTDLHKGITMAQIAKAAGVSQGAISSLLNDRDYGIRVSEKTRERVFKVCREMGYIPNDLRAVVRMYPEVGDVCLLLASTISGGLTDPFIVRLSHSVMTAVSDPSKPLTIATYDPGQDYGAGGLEGLPHPIRSGVASKFLFHGPANPGLIQHIVRRGVPVVSLGTEIHLPGVISMVPDYPTASHLAFEHLHKLGHRHIGIVSGPFGATDGHIIDLHRGVRKACADLGLTLDPQNIIYGDLGYEDGARAFAELYGRAVKPTAIFCLSDNAAAGVLAHAQHRGVKVPEQLSVVGCGDDVCSHFILPSLTTVHLPAEEMAERGVREIERLVRETVPIEPRKHLVPVALVERGSSGPAPTA